MTLLPLYRALDPSLAGKLSTLVRYLILDGDRLFMQADPEGLYDTPVQEIVMPGQPKVSNEVATRMFAEKSGTRDFSLRYLFTVGGFASAGDIKLYAVFFNEESKGATTFSENYPQAEGMTNDRVDRIIHHREIAPMLLNEIYRIHTITMAWKTYDSNGMRLYPIKNYRPTFRLRDLHEWSVDYDDTSWLDVARNNQDKPFFRLRRLWNRITGNVRTSSRTSE